MMRRTDRPRFPADRTDSLTDCGVDADDFALFLLRHRRKNCADPLCHHALSRAGRAAQQDIVSARRGNLHRTLDILLPEYFGKIEL